MTREELKEHCLKQVEMCEFRARGKGEKPSGKIYEEHKLTLELLENELRWIPVSERSPEKSGNYWCTFGGTNFTGSDYYRTESDAKEIFDDSEEYAGWRSRNVIAWMPLPKGYGEIKE